MELIGIIRYRKNRLGSGFNDTVHDSTILVIILMRGAKCRDVPKCHSPGRKFYSAMFLCAASMTFGGIFFLF